MLDVLFTKHEQKASVVLKSKKTAKPPLDQARVELMFGKINCPAMLVADRTFLECINRRYGKSYDNQDLMSSLNQKCRDAKLDWFNSHTALHTSYVLSNDIVSVVAS